MSDVKPDETAAVYRRICQVLEQQLGWVDVDGLEGADGQPVPLTDRTFRLLFEGFDLPAKSRRRPGQVIRQDEVAQLVVHHALNRAAMRETKLRAISEFDRAIDALLSDDLTRGWLRVDRERAVRRVNGAAYEQSLRFTAVVTRTVPPAGGS